jgi:hypothetical protein
MYGSCSHAGHRASSLQLLGLDYLVDSDLVPWLLEVNGTPSLVSEHPIYPAGDVAEVALAMRCNQCDPPTT